MLTERGTGGSGAVSANGVGAGLGAGAALAAVADSDELLGEGLAVAEAVGVAETLSLGALTGVGLLRGSPAVTTGESGDSSGAVSPGQAAPFTLSPFTLSPFTLGPCTANPGGGRRGYSSGERGRMRPSSIVSLSQTDPVEPALELVPLLSVACSSPPSVSGGVVGSSSTPGSTSDSACADSSRSSLSDSISLSTDAGCSGLLSAGALGQFSAPRPLATGGVEVNVGVGAEVVVVEQAEMASRITTGRTICTFNLANRTATREALPCERKARGRIAVPKDD